MIDSPADPVKPEMNARLSSHCAMYSLASVASSPSQHPHNPGADHESLALIVCRNHESRNIVLRLGHEIAEGLEAVGGGDGVTSDHCGRIAGCREGDGGAEESRECAHEHRSVDAGFPATATDDGGSADRQQKAWIYGDKCPKRQACCPIWDLSAWVRGSAKYAPRAERAGLRR